MPLNAVDLLLAHIHIPSNKKNDKQKLQIILHYLTDFQPLVINLNQKISIT